jgi:hypothetical protein
MRFKLFTFLLIALFAVTIFDGCGKSKRKMVFDTKPVSIKKFDTPLGADPSVTADMGGAGFTGEGWQTKADYNILGSKNAVKGGSLVMSIPDFPATLRTQGKDANSYFNRMAEAMMYYSLENIG